MSAPILSGDILHTQRLLACAGLSPGGLDGVWGPKTDAAAWEWDRLFARIREESGEFDGRTEGLLRTLLPAAQSLMRRLLCEVQGTGLDARVISGTRSYREQDALYRQGRHGDTRQVVTHARGGQSNHNFGIAVDLGLFDGGRYLQESPLYARAGEISRRVEGLEWGGDWPARKRDRPHYQVATGLSIAEVRSRFERGRPILSQRNEARGEVA